MADYRGSLEPQANGPAFESDGDMALISIAISLKRIAGMMEEDCKPRIELAPEGWVSDQEHRRILREGLAEGNAIMSRVADALWGNDDTSGLLQLLDPIEVRNHF